MKTLRNVLLAILFFVSSSINAGFQKNVVVDGIKYRITIEQDMKWRTSEAYVISNDERKYSGDILIPSSIDIIVDKTETDAYFGSYKCSVVGISNDAFVGCSGITSITFPRDRMFANIDGSYFIGCTNLSSIKFLEYYYNSENSNVIIIDDYLVMAFENAIIPDNIKSIGQYAFVCCPNLNIDLKNIHTVGDYAFAGHKGNISISMEPQIINERTEESVIKVGSYAFEGCAGLTEFSFVRDNVGGYPSIFIYNHAFKDCINLETFSLPKQSLFSIGEGAFSGCGGLKDVYCYSEKRLITSVAIFDESIKNATLHSYDTFIEAYKESDSWGNFGKYEVLEKITDFGLTYFIDGVESKTVQYKYDDVITPEPYPVKEGYTFSGWKDLPANMPGKDIKIYGVFTKNEINEGKVIYWAKNENAVVAGNENATGETSILSSVEFSNKQLPVTEIGDNSFKGRSDITKINIPATITKIGERSFANIDHLTDVTIYAKSVPETDRTAFENSYIEDYVTLHVPAGSVDKYKAVAPWKNFKSVVPIEGTKEIPAPEIVFEKGEVTFTCEEEGVTFHYEVTPLGQDAGKADKITLGQSYKIKVYASKEGCQDSEIVTKEVSIKKGDLNLDGKVDVADHVELTNIILNAEEEESDKKE